jgi:hypothetical protein
MAAQQSVFTAVGSDVDALNRLIDRDLLKKQVEEDFPQGFGEIEEPFRPLTGNPILSKVRIPGSWKAQLITSLHLMGVSNLTLFPGPDGLGEFASQRIMMTVPIRDWLSGRTPS